MAVSPGDLLLRKKHDPTSIWSVYKKRLSMLGLGISGNYFPVSDIGHTENQVGYTGSDGVIHLAPFYHPLILTLMKEHSIEEKLQCIKGTFLHELMHQIETDFAARTPLMDRCKTYGEKMIFAEISNIVEDPAIEYQARFYMGGDALRALQYMTYTFYKLAPDISKCRTPFEQYTSALIQYGDGGLIRGEFTFPEALKYFKMTLPTIDRIIEEPNGATRLQMAYDVYETTRPLWQSVAEDATKLNEFLTSLKERGKGVSSGSGMKSKPEKGEDDGDGDEDVKKRRRKVTFKKVSKEELEKLAENGTEGEDDGESDITVLYCDDDDSSADADPSAAPAVPADAGDEKGDDPGSGNSARKSSKTGTDPCDGDGGESAPDKGDPSEMGADKDDGDGKAGDTEKETPYKRPESNDGSAAPKGSPLTIDYSDVSSGSKVTDEDGMAGESADEEIYELSEEDLERILREIESCADELDQENHEISAESAEPLDLPIVQRRYSKPISVLNRRIPGRNDPISIAAYDKIVDEKRSGINRLASQLRRIFANDAEDNVYRESGRVDVKRLADARVTSRVFNRRVDPANKSNMCAIIAVDNSGSMCGNKIAKARECTIALAEVFATLHIPIKVIGFTGDTGGYDAVHYHYVNWSKSKRERTSLIGIQALSDNFDGYSIRYATEILKKRPESHKMLIVISDGQPACYYYESSGEGVADTKNAVQEAQKLFPTIGVAIDANVNVLHSIYGSNFVHVRKVSEMFETIGKVIKKEVQKHE